MMGIFESEGDRWVSESINNEGNRMEGKIASYRSDTFSPRLKEEEDRGGGGSNDMFLLPTLLATLLSRTDTISIRVLN